MRKTKREPKEAVQNPEAANLQLAFDWLQELVAGYLRVHFRQSDSFRPGPLEF